MTRDVRRHVEDMLQRVVRTTVQALQGAEGLGLDAQAVATLLQARIEALQPLTDPATIAFVVQAVVGAAHAIASDRTPTSLLH